MKGLKTFRASLFALLMFSLWFAVPAHAAPCASDTLDNYLGTSCTVGDFAVTFASTAYGESNTPGCPHIYASDVVVTPQLDGTIGAGFKFSAAWTVSGCGLISSTIRYAVTVHTVGQLIVKLKAGQSGASFSGTSFEIADVSIANNSAAVNLCDETGCTTQSGSATFTGIDTADVVINPIQVQGTASVDSVTVLLDE